MKLEVGQVWRKRARGQWSHGFPFRIVEVGASHVLAENLPGQTTTFGVPISPPIRRHIQTYRLLKNYEQVDPSNPHD